MLALAKKYQKYLIAAGCLLLVFGGYFYWKSGDKSAVEDAATLSVNPGPLPEEAAFGEVILTALNDLRQLKLDARVFDDPVFRSLVDYTVATTSEPLGRPDPFAPIAPTSTKKK